MLGAIVSLLLVVAAAYAVTQVGGVITLLFIAAVLFLAYRRLSLLAFTTTFTVLLAAYTVLGAGGAPAGIWKGFLWLLLAALWLLDRKSTRLNSSHEWISYAVFCLKKKNGPRYLHSTGHMHKSGPNTGLFLIVTA